MLKKLLHAAAFIEDDRIFLALVILGSLSGGAAGAALAFWMSPCG